MLTMTIVGISLVAITCAIHAFGSEWWMSSLLRKFAGRDGNWRSGTTARALMSTGVALMGLHLLEVLVWALTYLALPGEPKLKTFEEAFYFSIVTFTTLGYGDVTVGEEWRILAGLEAANGIMMFGWTMALIVALSHRLLFDDADDGTKG